MFLCGKTGSGKTYCARRAIKHYPFVLAIDPKCTLGGKQGLPGFKMIRNPARLSGMKDPYIQVRLDPDKASVEIWDAVYWWAFRAGKRMVYTDEVYLVLDG